MFVFVDDIWILYLVLMNLYEEIRFIFLGGFFCKVWYNGNVLCLLLFNIYEVVCDVDIDLYLYDIKNCILQFYVLGYYSEDLKFKIKLLIFNIDMYIYYGMWNVFGICIFVYD